MHPIARELLDAFASQPYFQSNRLTATIAERNPIRCVNWTLDLVEPAVLDSKAPQIVVETLAMIRNALKELTPNAVPKLDEASSQCWCLGSFADSRPYLQRVVARLGWATILLLCKHSNTDFESQFTGIHISANINGQLRELANQCAMAIDMVYTDTNDGRLMVASAFTREMDSDS